MTTPATVSFTGFPFDTRPEIERLIECYQNTGEAQEVSFRELVPWLKVGERATHYLHSYPAKLLPQIAHFFLAASNMSEKGASVLDPFSGTGTVALEAILSGKKAFYADANPVARLITSVKTSVISLDSVRAAYARAIQRYKKSRSSTPPDVVNIAHWYEPQVIGHLCRLKAGIDAESDGHIKDFLYVTFSSVVRKCSLADPRLSVPVRLKEYSGRRVTKKISVIECFSEQFEANCKRMAEYVKLTKICEVGHSAGSDARKLELSPGTPLPSGTIDLVITSPPYAGAQKYIRATSLSLGWLGFVKSSQLRELEDKNIGREHIPKQKYESFVRTGIASADLILESVYKENPLRAAIASTYLIEMKSALREIYRVLKTGGRMILVIGNNVVCGKEFMSSEYLSIACQELGMSVELKLIDSIKSRGLMTKRNKTASLITREWVLVLRKDS
jgi:DNA modification methylase